MKVSIKSIIIEEDIRIRQDPGDLSPLENSIEKVGLLNPIVIDEDNRLIAGYRRLSACRNLGWEEIEVNMIKFGGDELKMLDAEVDENLFRKAFTPGEIESIEQRRQEIIRKLKGNIFQRFWRWLRNLFTRGESKKTAKKKEEVIKPGTKEPYAIEFRAQEPEVGESPDKKTEAEKMETEESEDEEDREMKNKENGNDRKQYGSGE
ncbi:MAG: ParB N-terminal domain-containing protein [Candidatus Auribacterota bacterium]|nr:ParB N-terminal domain-containing protein [Candidatus Auribacterota bacterium]